MIYCAACTRLLPQAESPQHDHYYQCLKPYALVRTDLKMSLEHMLANLTAQEVRLDQQRASFEGKMKASRDSLSTFKEALCDQFELLYKALRLKLEALVERVTLTEEALGQECAAVGQGIAEKKAAITSLKKVFS